MNNQTARIIFVLLCIGYMFGQTAFFGMLFSGEFNRWGFVLGAAAQICAIAIIVLAVKTGKKEK